MPCLLSWSLLSSRLFLPTGPSHRQGEVGEGNARLPAKDGICTESGKMVRREQDASPRIDGETANLPANATGQAQLASWIKEKQHALAYPIALTRRPQANPLEDCDFLAWSSAADRLLDMEADQNRLNWLCAIAAMTFDVGHGSGKDHSRRLCELREGQCFRTLHGITREMVD